MQYEAELIHAIDGMGTGLVIVPCMHNFLVKVYSEGSSSGRQGNQFGGIIKAMLEIVNFINKN